MESSLLGNPATEGRITESVLAPVADLARQLADCRRSSLMLPDANGELRVAAASGLPAAVAARARVRLGEPVAGIVAQTRRSLVSNEARDRHPSPAGATGAGLGPKP